jgi:hypothetical protein
MSAKKWKFRQDGRMHYALVEHCDIQPDDHLPPIAFVSFIEQQHRDLIAAAPEMLEALKIMTQWNVEYEEQRSLNDALPNEIRDALAIIAKAEGTTNNQQTKGF